MILWEWSVERKRGYLMGLGYPRGPALRTRRSRSSPVMRTLTPVFSSPMRFSFGTKTSSKMSSPVFDPLIPSLSSFRAQEKPLDVFSTTNVEIPLDPRSGSVFAYTTMKSASGP